MITLPRRVARLFRAVLRRSLMAQWARVPWPLVLCQADVGGLLVQAANADLAVRYHHSGPQTLGALAFRSSVLAEFEGTKDEPVVLEQEGFGKGIARWHDGDVPRSLEFETVTPDSLPPFPAVPRKTVSVPVEFLRALDEAARTTARESVRYALARVQLRGRKGEVVGTDGRQLLVLSGFQFPWAEDLLVPRLLVFGGRELPFEGDVRLGRTDSHVALQAGPWTFLLAIDKASRYPPVERVLPNGPRAPGRFRFDPKDAALLLRALPKLPGKDADHAPVTLDAGPPMAVRVRGEEGKLPTELVLPHSTSVGPTRVLCLDRRHLHRALQLGLTELEVWGADKALACRAPDRTYVFMPLEKEAAVRAPTDQPHVAPAEEAADTEPPTERRDDPMPPPRNNGPTEHLSGNGHPPEQPPVPDPIAEGEALRALLQEAHVRVSPLVGALKHQRRQAKAVRAALDSLRQLNIGP